MTTATAKDVKKSPIPKRILNRIDAAFGSQSAYITFTETGKTSEDEIKKAHKKVAKDCKEVVAYIEDLIAKSAG